MCMLYENKYMYNSQGGLGGYPPPPEAEEIFKKSNKMETFPLFLFFFFAFWQGSLNP